MSAGDLPPHVVSGQPIASVWGNNVVDEMLRKRNEVIGPWSHAGGNTPYIGQATIGVTALGPYAFPVRMAVWATFSYGYSGCGIAGSAILLPANGGPTFNLAKQYAHAAMYGNVSICHAWDVAAGQQAGFSTYFNWTDTETSGVSVYFSSGGTYLVQRTGTP
jgi:hypothetical protein